MSDKNPVQEMDDSIWKGGDTVPDTPDDVLKAFVMGVCNNEIFTDRHLSEHEVQNMSMVFMPLALGALSHPHMPDSYRDDIGCIWEWNKDAGPRSINGMPMFMSFRMLNKRDAERAFKAIAEEMKRREEVKL